MDSDDSPKTVNILYIQGLLEFIKRVLSGLDIVVRSLQKGVYLYSSVTSYFEECAVVQYV